MGWSGNCCCRATLFSELPVDEAEGRVEDDNVPRSGDRLISWLSPDETRLPPPAGRAGRAFFGDLSADEDGTSLAGELSGDNKALMFILPARRPTLPFHSGRSDHVGRMGVLWGSADQAPVARHRQEYSGVATDGVCFDKRRQYQTRWQVLDKVTRCSVESARKRHQDAIVHTRRGTGFRRGCTCMRAFLQGSERLCRSAVGPIGLELHLSSDMQQAVMARCRHVLNRSYL